MKKQSVIVVLEDDKFWNEHICTSINELIQSSGHTWIEVVAFDSDRSAAEYIRRQPERILGYVQDLQRGDDELYGARGFAGIRFFNEIIQPLTPGAWVIILSGIIEGVMSDNAFKHGQIFELMSKSEFERRQFYNVVLRAIHSYRNEVAEEDINSNDKNSLIQVVSHPIDNLRQLIASNPDLLHKIEPRHFEELIGQMFRSDGWEVDFTASTRDGGYDIIAIRKFLSTDIRILIEAKRFAPNRPVSVQLVRSLYGLRLTNAASQVILATSSYVSKDAKKEFHRVVPWELNFLEREKIIAWCKQNGGVSLYGSLDK